MPYRGRQPALELGGLGIACLAGENGAGKSAILDGITWALWGRSRAGAAADPLVSAGESEMSVELEFRVGEGVYRVLRRHRRPRSGSSSGQSALEFQVWDGEQFRAQSGARSRETQEQITGLLRLDYNTFINTAFLVQGRADMFTTMRPAERKRMLGEVLGLTPYDAIAERAREQARESETARRTQEALAQGFGTAMAQNPEVRQELQATAQELVAKRRELDTVTGGAETFQVEVARLREGRADVQRLSADAERLGGELETLQAELLQIEEKVSVAEAVMERSDEVEEGYSSLQAARAALADHGARARQTNELTARKPPFEQVLSAERTQLERDVATRESQVQELRRRSELRGALEQRLEAAESRRREFAASRAQLVVKSDEREGLGRDLESKRALIGRLQQESKEIQESLEILESRGAQRSTGDLCPVCRTHLGAHGVQQVRDHYAQRLSTIAGEREGLTEEGRRLRVQYDELVRSTQQENAELDRSSAHTESEIGAIRAEIQISDTAAADLPSIRAELTSAQGKLDDGVFGREERAALASLEEEILAAGYDPEAHGVAQSWAVELERWDQEHRALDEARTSHSSHAARAEELAARRDEAEGSLADVTGHVTRLLEEVEDRAGVEARLAGFEATIVRLRSTISDLDRRHGALEQGVAQMEQQRSALREARVDERRSAEEKGIYEELATAFGVRGIQALLVETAIPEIEEEANRLLSAMTENRMHLRLDTQRETRGGTQQETLEVMISDEWGTRAYEMFSGGEAFRIDFALRVALSQVLARRSGAEVPLLFIDEGFGTQDSAGRQHLVQAVSALWNDPSFHNGLILVITHIEEIKNQFDSRIEITKTERGSRCELVG